MQGMVRTYLNARVQVGAKDSEVSFVRLDWDLISLLLRSFSVRSGHMHTEMARSCKYLSKVSALEVHIGVLKELP